jgi:hypothetical protein
MNDRTVELHFIDGPLQGTRKMEDESIILRNRAYRYLQPTRYSPEQVVPNTTESTWINLTCVEYFYLPFPLPRSYNGPQRFAMLLDKGLN